MPLEPNPPTHQKSEYGLIAYQIKGNAAYNKILANALLLHLPLTLGMGSKG